jgi:chromosome segregation ATPase
MRRSLFVVLCFLLLSVPSVCQTTANDSQGMQALVAEVRQLRKDLQASNGNALRGQILLYRLQVQEATVARVSQQLTDTRGRLADTQRHRAELAATLKRLEESPGSPEMPPADRKQVQYEISRLKTELENLASEEQQRQTAAMEAEEQLRTEQAKLGGLEERVDRLEKELDGNPH